MLKFRSFVLVLVAFFGTSACSGSSTAPTATPAAKAAGAASGSPDASQTAGKSPTPAPTVTPAATPVPGMVPPPTGMDPEVWRTGFSADELMRRAEIVHAVLPVDASEKTKEIFDRLTANVTGFVEGKTQLDTLPDPTGYGNFVVSVVANLVCAGKPAVGACTTRTYDSTGRVTGGTIQFSLEVYMQNEVLVVHELLWTLGLHLNPANQKLGITSYDRLWEWNKPYPTDEELKMLRARYDCLLLSRYSPK